MQAKLHLVKGNPQGKQVEIPAGTLTVGRAEDSDLIVASTRVSRHHCEIVNDGKALTIRDKGSGNGTLVNGAKVEQQVLKPGDEVQVGPLTFVVEIDGVRESAAKPAAPPAKAAPAAAPKAAPAKPAAQARPAAQAKPAAAAPAKAAVQPKAAPKPAAGPRVPMPPGKRAAPADVLASLEQLAARKKPPGGPAGPSAPPQKKKDDQVIEISDEDLIDPDK